MEPAVIGAMIPIVALIIGGAIAIFRPLAQAEARKSAAALPPGVAARLERMEQSLEAIALEIERISEGQRFTTKLLAERSGAPAQLKPSVDAERSVIPPGEHRS